MTKERSPNYPYIGLSAALEAVRRLYDKDRRSPVSSETFAKALGHASLSGPAASKGAAVRQFGLMESVSTGKYRVSDDALTLMLKKPGEPEYDQTIRRVALKPPLFAELFSAYPEASDDTLRFHLIKDRKFSEDGASRALKSFRDTIAVAKLVPGSYNSSGEDEILGKTPPVDPFSELLDMRFRKSATKISTQRQEGQETTKVPLTYILPGGVNAQLTFAGADLTGRAIQRLIDYLGMLKEDLPEGEGPSAGERVP
jgi:hypothetical protein